MYKYRLHRQPDDSDIQPNAPVLHIPYVTLHTTFHLPQFFCLSSESCHLRPTCHTWLHKVSHHILIYQFRVLLRMCQHVWSRSYDAHIPLQHIQELRQLVYICFTHKVPERILSRIILRRLHLVGICIHMHRSELVAIKRLTIYSRSLLFDNV